MRSLLTLSLACVATPASAQSDTILLLEYETSSQSEGGSGSSRGRQALAERIVASRGTELEVEYDLPDHSEEPGGNAVWMFPARVSVRSDGSKSVLNGDAMQRRVDQWLDKAGWTREVCGRWIFTWSAFQIRCDEAAAIESIEAFGMRPARMRAGEAITLAGTSAPVMLTSAEPRGQRRVLIAQAPLDPSVQKVAAAEMEVVVAEIAGEALSIEQAMASLGDFSAEGVIKVEFEIDSEGLVWKRIRTVEMEITGLFEGVETHTSRETVTRYSLEDWARLFPQE